MRFSDRLKKTVVGSLVLFGLFVAGVQVAVRVFEYRHSMQTGSNQATVGIDVASTTALLDSAQPTTGSVNQGRATVSDQKARSLEEDLRQLTELLIGPKDAKGRFIVRSDETMSFLYRQLGAFDHPERWNVSMSSKRFTPEKIDGDTYVLTVPFDTTWGTSGVTFEPYTDNRPVQDPFQNDIEFGPLEYSDFVGGSFRWAGFKKIPRRDINAAKTDIKLAWRNSGCSEEVGEAIQFLPLAQIGRNQVLRYEVSGCGEGGGIQYEVFGSHANYVFSSVVVANDELLRWSVERFQEK